LDAYDVANACIKKEKKTKRFSPGGDAKIEFFSEKGAKEIVLFQLPSILPIPNSIKPQYVDEELPDPKEKKLVDNTVKDSKIETDKTDSLPIKPPEPTGHLGKLQILKSGKMRLKIGNFVFEVSQGTSTSFLTTVGLIHLPSNNMIDLGSLEKYFICTPDIEALVAMKEWNIYK